MITFLSTQILDYEEFKENLDIALNNTADNMVRVGYLLQQARDTDILKESGYSGMGEFAQKEYGLTADQTSRFIGIAERFGDGEGRLMDQWQQFGFSKLSEMLTLPDHVNEVLTPDITREEIRELKAEVKAEEQVTPIEAAIEQAETGGEDFPILQRFFMEYFRPAEHAWDFYNAIDRDWAEVWSDAQNKAVVLDALAPSGIAILEARVPGVGRCLLSFKGETSLPRLVYVRGDRPDEDVEWGNVREGFSALAEDNEFDAVEEKAEAIKHIWEKLYGEKFPGKKETSLPESGKSSEKSDKKSEKSKKESKKPEKKVKIAPAQKKKENKSPEADNKSPDVETKSHEVENDAPFEADGAAVADPVNGAVNPPEAPEAADDKVYSEEMALSHDEREERIKDAVKLLNRVALDLANYAGKFEALRTHHGYTFVEGLIFDTDACWEKIKHDAEELKRLLYARMMEEHDEDPEDEK